MAYETKDSGERLNFDSGMVRDVTTGKTKCHLVFSGPMLVRWAELLTRGAEKYEDDNWMKANGHEELKRFRESAARHFFQWMNGETDEDHAAAVFFNINGYEYVKGRINSDDRFRTALADALADLRAPGAIVEVDANGRPLHEQQRLF